MNLLKNLAELFDSIVIYIFKYLDKQQYAKITDNIYLGNLTCVHNIEFLKKNKISVVVNCSKTIPFQNQLNNIVNYRVDINDDLSHGYVVSLIPYIIRLVPILINHIDKGQRILIHCRAGMQRSASVVAAVLMKKYKLNKSEAISRIQSKRNIAFRPFPHFGIALDVYQNYLHSHPN